MDARYNRLISLYWKAVYCQDDQSSAVREVSIMTKRVIEDEIKKHGYTDHTGNLL